jgi:hypothetical protein
MTTTPDRPPLDQERQDILETLGAHRGFLLVTVRGLSDGEATTRTTVSQLHLAGIVKHVAHTEQMWTRFIVEGPSVMHMDPASMEAHAASFQLADGETLAGVLEFYAAVARETDALVASLPTLDEAQPLPEAPWFVPGASRTARRVFLHIVAETAQHAGHADIIRESLDGARTIG